MLVEHVNTPIVSSVISSGMNRRILMAIAEATSVTGLGAPAGRTKKKDLAMRTCRRAVIVVFSALQAASSLFTIVDGKTSVWYDVLSPSGDTWIGEPHQKVGGILRGNHARVQSMVRRNL